MFAMTLLVVSASVSAEVNAVTPSTNAANMANGWAYFTAEVSGPGEVTLTFNSTRSHWSCFEYRSDGDTGQAIDATNYNALVNDGLYPYECVNNSTLSVTTDAQEYVEVRMVFGAEGDERFDWTYVPVQPTSIEDCMSGGFENYGFSNQGQCIRYVNTGKDSRP